MWVLNMIGILVFINKLVTKILHLLHHNATQYPGFIIYDVLKQHHILERIKYPKYVIAVTGSSGKGSTVNLIKHILEDNGLDVGYNAEGGNGVLGVISYVLNNCNRKGEFMHDVLLLECDEKHLKLIFQGNKMTHLIITNITRDQPVRNGNQNIIFEEICKAIKGDETIILNADDPLVSRLKYSHKGKIVTYGVKEFSDSYNTPITDSVDYAYCPICHSKLKYNYYHYGHIGNYECPNKDFERGKVDFEVNEVNYKKNQIKINRKNVYLNYDAIYAIYYTVAAYALCSSLGLDDAKIRESLNVDKAPSKRGKMYKLNDRNLTMLESKNENNLSYYQSIKYITNQENTKTVILGFDNVSRRYHYNDLSWLYDVDFELLNDEKIDKIIVIGRFRYDVMARLKLANIARNKIIMVNDLNNLKETIINQTKGDIYTMVCFDMTAIIKKLVEGDQHE